MFSKRYSKGFTLIELLVVISIIGLLSSVVLASVNDARAKARDAKRRSDLRQLVNAVELYYSKYNVYPGTDGWILTDNGPIDDKLQPEFIPSIPFDPKYSLNLNTNYQYWRKDNEVVTGGTTCIAASSNSGKYAFYAQLEKPTASEIASFPNNDAFDDCIKSGWPYMTLKAGN